MTQAPTPNAPRATVRILAALSDEKRYSIVELLSQRGELSCGAICGSLGLSPSLLSHHLTILEGASVVERRKDGLWTLNRLRRDVLALHISELDRLLQPSGAQ